MLSPKERLALIDQNAQTIHKSTMDKAQWRDASDNPEWIALCLINQIEWQIQYEDRNLLAKRILFSFSLPTETKSILRKYFDIY